MKLPSLESLTAGINIEEVEKWGKEASYKKQTKNIEEKKELEPVTIADEAGQTKLKNKTKKKRKPRYPKHYKPDGENSPIDPERWTPLRDRSYYKGKRRDKKRTGGHQGGIQEKITAALDYGAKKTPTVERIGFLAAF